MRKQMNFQLGWLLAIGAVLMVFGGSACAIKHTIEPSDKPLIVNLNVKIDHEVKVKVQEENRDLLDLEEEYLKSKTKKKKGKVSS
jgi:hypothetical protein